MSAPPRALLIFLVFVLALGPAVASDSGVSLSGFICARPFAPPCADAPATYKNAGDLAACQRELDRYAAWTAAYRDCLERQIAGAIRQANDVLDRFHCLSQRNCPPTVAKSK
jgi:hypothetical protein